MGTRRQTAAAKARRAMKTFIIHLERATERRAQVQHLQAAAPWPAQVLPAVDGARLDHWPLAARVTPRYPFALSAGEVGCFLSHRAAWTRIVEEGLEAALILEDDVALEADFAAAAAFAAGHVARIGYIQFQVRPVPEAAERVAQAGAFALARTRPVMLRTSAQLVSQAAARRLLDLTQTFDRPVDTFLQMAWETGITPHVVTPSCVSDRTAETGGSTISAGKRRGLLASLGREIARSRYRRAIARLSR